MSVKAVQVHALARVYIRILVIFIVHIQFLKVLRQKNKQGT
jgi:hypothetical protein